MPELIRVDVTAEVCPMTYVRLKLAMEPWPDGTRFEVLLAGSEPLKNLPRAALEDGHEVLELAQVDGDRHRLLLRKRAGSRRASW